MQIMGDQQVEKHLLPMMSDNKKDADGKTLGNASLKAMLEKALPMLTFRNSFSVVIVCWLAVLTLHLAGEARSCKSENEIFDKLQIWKEGERERRQLAEERGDSGILAGTSNIGDPTILSTLSTWWSTLTTLVDEKLNSMKRIDILEKTIGKLSQRGAFCGYRQFWNSANSVITYQKLLLFEGDAGTLDAPSGVWTTNVPGIYMVTWSLVNELTGDDKNWIYLLRNGERNVESDHASYIHNSANSNRGSSSQIIGEQGGRTMPLRLNAADTLSLRTSETSFQGSAFTIQFCVNLVAAD